MIQQIQSLPENQLMNNNFEKSLLENMNLRETQNKFEDSITKNQRQNRKSQKEIFNINIKTVDINKNTFNNNEINQISQLEQNQSEHSNNLTIVVKNQKKQQLLINPSLTVQNQANKSIISSNSQNQIQRSICNKIQSNISQQISDNNFRQMEIQYLDANMNNNHNKQEQKLITMTLKVQNQQTLKNSMVQKSFNSGIYHQSDSSQSIIKIDMEQYTRPAENLNKTEERSQFLLVSQTKQIQQIKILKYSKKQMKQSNNQIKQLQIILQQNNSNIQQQIQNPLISDSSQRTSNIQYTQSSQYVNSYTCSLLTNPILRLISERLTFQHLQCIQFPKSNNSSKIMHQNLIAVQQNNFKQNLMKLFHKNLFNQQNSQGSGKYIPPNINKFDSYKQQTNFHRQFKYNNQEQMLMNMETIDSLRKDLLKSTQNNINAIFNTSLHDDYCIVDAVQNIKSQVKGLYEKMQKMQQRQYMNRYMRQQQNYQRQQINGQQGNTVINIGNNLQGQIITIHPKGIISIDPYQKKQKNNQKQSQRVYNNYNQYRNYDKQDNSYNRQKRSNSIQKIQKIQLNFLSTLQQFRKSIQKLIDIKITQVKQSKYNKQNKQIKQKQKYIQQLLKNNDNKNIAQKLKQQQKNQQQKQLDYGYQKSSINVMYIQRLRQFQEKLLEKQRDINRLQKENYYLEKHIEKLEKIKSQRSIPERDSTIIRNLKSQEKYSYSSNIHNDQNNKNSFKKVNKKLSSLQNISFHIINNSITQKSQSKSNHSSDQNIEQKIRKITNLSNQELNSSNNLINFNKRKNPQSFHYQSNNQLVKQISQLKQKINHYELLLKQKDIRINQLQSTIFDFLENSKKWKSNQNQQKMKNSNNSSQISSVNSNQTNTQLLHMKIKNLKTLLKQSKRQAQNYKKLLEKGLSTNVGSQKTIRISGTEVDSLFTQSKQQKNIMSTQTNYNQIFDFLYPNSPFQQIQTNLNGNFNNFNDNIKMSDSQMGIDYENLLSFNQNFIKMSWSLKQILMKLCKKQVNNDKINKTAKNFIKQFKYKNQKLCQNIQKRLVQNNFSRIRAEWFLSN